MYKLPTQLRNEIINYITNVTVPASVGSDLIKIAHTLTQLEEIKEEPKPDEPKKNHK